MYLCHIKDVGGISIISNCSCNLLEGIICLKCKGGFMQNSAFVSIFLPLLIAVIVAMYSLKKNYSKFYDDVLIYIITGFISFLTFCTISFQSGVDITLESLTTDLESNLELKEIYDYSNTFIWLMITSSVVSIFIRFLPKKEEN